MASDFTLLWLTMHFNEYTNSSKTWRNKYAQKIASRILAPIFHTMKKITFFHSKIVLNGVASLYNVVSIELIFSLLDDWFFTTSRCMSTTVWWCKWKVFPLIYGFLPQILLDKNKSKVTWKIILQDWISRKLTIEFFKCNLCLCIL